MLVASLGRSAMVTSLRGSLLRPSANAWVRFNRSLAKHPGWLSVFVEGDSWFAFPGFFNRTSIPSHLGDNLDAKFAMFRVADVGDHVREMVRGRQRRRIRDRLKNDRADFRLLLFSGGGNDLIDEFPNIIQRSSNPVDATSHINFGKLTALVDEVLVAYRDLISLRDRYRPDCWIVAHTYDRPFPDGRKVKKLGIKKGPWLLPALKSFGIDPRFHRGISRIVMDHLGDALMTLDSKARRVKIIDTRGTLTRRDDWGDEIHPTNNGFKKISKEIKKGLHELFPGHI
jgi:hypothetical protein